MDIDLDCLGLPGTGIPAAGFSAAAPLSAADIWNAIAPGVAAGLPLVDTAGALTAATWANTAGFCFGFNNAGTAGNHELLLDDLQCGASTMTIGGLLAGTYDVYTYAWAPDSPGAFLTSVSVNGGAPQIVGGSAVSPGGSPPPPGTYGTPGHYAFNPGIVVPAGGAITIVCAISSGFVSVNGVQLRHTPPAPPVGIVDCQILPTVTQGCQSVLSFAGSPSATSTSAFTTTYGSLNVGVNGVVFYGITGPTLSVWSPESNLCVKAPVQRMNAVPGAAGNTGGTAGNCDGAYSFDMNPVIQGMFGGLGTPMAAGQQVNSQGWQRDPASAKTTNLTDSFSFVVGP
jgi:hypothetical protein